MRSRAVAIIYPTLRTPLTHRQGTAADTLTLTRSKKRAYILMQQGPSSTIEIVLAEKRAEKRRHGPRHSPLALVREEVRREVFLVEKTHPRHV